jgi:hypothetical protein
LKVILCCVAPVTIGAGVVTLLVSNLRSRRCLYCTLLIGAGISLDTLIFFWFRRAFVTVEWMLVAVSICLIWHHWKRPSIKEGPDLNRPGDWRLRFLMISAALIALGYYIVTTSRGLHGGWDGWAVWNLHARVLVRGGLEWPSTLKMIGFSNPEHPLLLPGLIARFWRFLRTEATLVPIAIGLLFTALSAAFLFGIVKELQSEKLAILATVIVLATPFFIRHGAEQYADVPLGFFILACLGMIWLYEEHENHPVGLLILAGLFAGSAGWTKNEGILFIVAITIAYVLASPRDISSTLRKLSWMTIGAIPAVITIIYFKAIVTRPDVLFASQTATGMLSKITDVHRHAEIITHLAEIWTFGDWYYSPIPVLLLWATLHHFGRWSSLSNGFRVAVLTLVLVTSGYYFIYLITPFPLPWYVSASLNRLLLQLWPACLMVTFVMIGRPTRIRARVKWQLIPASVIVGLTIACVWIGCAAGQGTPDSTERPNQFIGSPLQRGYFVLIPESGTRPNMVVRLTSVDNGYSLAVTPLKLSKEVKVALASSAPTDIGISLVNPEITEQTIHLSLRTSEMERHTELKLLPGNQTAALLSEQFPEATPTETRESILTLRSTAEFSVLVLQKKALGFAPMQVEVVKPGHDAIVFPQFLLYGGWMTEVMLFNASQNFAAGRIAFFDPDHQQWIIRLNGIKNHTFNYAIDPGAGLHYSPSF